MIKQTVCGLCCLLATTGASALNEIPVRYTPLLAAGYVGVDDTLQHVVIDETFIADSGAITLTDILRRIPGIPVVHAPGQPDSVFLDGAYAQHVVVIVDGVRMNDVTTPNARARLDAMPASAIERITITSSPQSVRYGEGAVAGVIEVTTKRSLATAGTQQAVRLTVGDQGFRHLRAEAYADSGQGHTLFAEVGNTSQHGVSARIDDNERDGAHTMHWRAGYQQRSAEQALAVQLDDSDGSADYDDCFFGTAATDDCIATTRTRSVNVHYRNFATQAGEWSLVYAHLEQQRRLLAGPDDEQQGVFTGYSDQLQWHGDTPGVAGNVAWGVDWQRDRATAIYGPFSGELTQQGIFAEWSRHGEFDWQFGARAAMHDAFADATVINASIGGGDAVRWTVGYAEGYKTPTLYQLYDSFSGNPSLRPERNHEWSAAAAWQRGNPAAMVRIDGRLFFAEHDNFIDTDANWRYHNIDETVSRRGITIGAAAANALWRVGARVAVVEATRGGGRQLARRPRQLVDTFVTRVLTDTQSLTAGLRARSAVWDRDDTDTRLAGYSDAYLGWSYQPNKQLRWDARVDNLFDRRYVEADGYAAASRRWFVGMSWRW